MGPEDRIELLRIARLSLEERLRSGHALCGAPHRAALLAPRAAFVTVYVDGDLRGCIGRLDESAPAHRTVAELVVSAALEDPRFPPVEAEDLPRARIEVSLLGPRERIAGPAEIEVGRHGLVVTRLARRGLLLPKVAVEHGFGAEEFLRQTCYKAMLPAEAWRDAETVIERFEAEVFAEEPAALRATS